MKFNPKPPCRACGSPVRSGRMGLCTRCLDRERQRRKAQKKVGIRRKNCLLDGVWRDKVQLNGYERLAVNALLLLFDDMKIPLPTRQGDTEKVILQLMIYCIGGCDD